MVPKQESVGLVVLPPQLAFELELVEQLVELGRVVAEQQLVIAERVLAAFAPIWVGFVERVFDWHPGLMKY